MFSRTKHGADKIVKQLAAAKIPAGAIHGNKSQAQRERTLAAFKSGESKVLIATDIAARGIDIPGVSHVVNFDLPDVPEQYVHRIGRTARAGADGIAIAFCAPDERGNLRDIERTTRQRLPLVAAARRTSRPAPKPSSASSRRSKPGPSAANPVDQGRSPQCQVLRMTANSVRTATVASVTRTAPARRTATASAATNIAATACGPHIVPKRFAKPAPIRVPPARTKPAAPPVQQAASRSARSTAARAAPAAVSARPDDRISGASIVNPNPAWALG